ncbi:MULTISPECIES: paraquat-inducible protein A [Shewanella]|uniref:Paraquat-inducible protein A n=2 Tax=Unclassified Bacteria TaxID=49928 RepID=A0AAU6VR83_UNCXX|nr:MULTISPECIES: paraquat-inducible protein A [Shewanella]MBO2622310.1 paraquat-inducible protein A [Shewanella algae]MBO2647531.1 paraquat-inducible protein A [Shewanella algae]MCE9780314.1 paraquat-inducible protein A [Shewanella algae]MCE9826732.1 paraquat-inducible protein A [Shewanella algae]MCT8980554.1 paraquat-inducible protein A [Shewanella algae]
MRRILPIMTLLLSLALLLPGVTQPILSVSGTVEKAELTEAGLDMIAEAVSDGSGRDSARGMLAMISGMLGLNNLQGEMEVFNKTRSIWGTVTELHQHGNTLVAALVMLFSVIVPACKLGLMLLAQAPLSSKVRQIIDSITAAIAKWSMADVFVVALIITYMAGNASAGMGDLVHTHASLESGFWFFLGYCLLAIAGQYWLKPRQS